MEAVSVREDDAGPGERAVQATLALEREGTGIAQARHFAAYFLTRVQAEHGLHVSPRAMDLTQLVVSELVTNARKYAPGPVQMDLRIAGDAVEIVVWDCAPVLPVAGAADAGRVGRHGLEIVMAVAESFEARRAPVGKRITVRLALTDDGEAAPCPAAYR
ncbi:ATP-binding protein [Streptomyces hilarionis]|uniref:ATP-binding protein n=1 Tax=Streptomyces hilarionis TaxID=2839954 RepID=UPI00211A2FF0|nr:ATP-binding protein [Streptomyces hilarionis]MCQ9131195.1 ATP-binding protein [Streptomyces hilarionis]